MGPYPFGQAMADGTDVDHMYQVAEDSFDDGQLFVAQHDIASGEAIVRGADQELPVQLLQHIQASDRFSDDIIALLSIPLCFREVERYDETAPRPASPCGQAASSRR